jgi:hypothetical protein
MTTSKNIQTDDPGAAKRAVLLIGLVEAVAAVVVGMIARTVLPENVGRAIQWALNFLGPVIGINYALLQLKLDALLRREFRSLVATEMKDVRQILKFFDSYFRLGTSQLAPFRDEILSSAIHAFESLAQGEGEVRGDAYYTWLKNRLADTPNSVRAVSFRPLSVYTDDPREKNFIHQNAEAVDRGTKISRIFILEEQDLVSEERRTVIKNQCLNLRIAVHVVWKRSISREILRETEGGGFSIYDSEVVFFDRSYFERNVGGSDIEGSEPLMPRAALFCAPNPSFEKYSRIFESLENQVPYHSKDGEIQAYVHCMKDIDAFLTRKYKSVETLGQTENRDQESERDLVEWHKLKIEIKTPPEAYLPSKRVRALRAKE